MLIQLEWTKLEKSKALDKLREQTVKQMVRIAKEIQDQKQQMKSLEKVINILFIQELNNTKELKAKDKAAAFDSLMQLDLVASRMTATRNCLKDADNWSTV